MPLAEFLEALKPGDIILSSSRIMPLSFLIRLATWSRYSHSELYTQQKKSVGAHFTGILELKLEDQIAWHKYHRVLRPHESVPHGSSVARFAESLVGRHYDFIHLILYLWRIILGTLGRAPMSDDPKKHVCLELSAFCWHKFGVMVGGEYADNVTGRSFMNDPKLRSVF